MSEVMDIRFGDWILVGLQGKRGNTLWVDVYISPTSKSFWSSSPQQSHPRIQTSKSQVETFEYYSRPTTSHPNPLYPKDDSL
jgi:hypothetical protein